MQRPLQKQTSGITMGHALFFLQPRLRALITRVRVVRWERFDTQL